MTGELSNSRDPQSAAHDWLKRDGQVALATVMTTWGSAPVQAGGQMAVALDGDFTGSVSGGCIEADVIADAQDTMATGQLKVLEFGVADEVAWRAGLACGGRMSILIEPLTRDRDLEFIERLLGARRSRQALVVRTLLGNGERTLYKSPIDAPSGVARGFDTAESAISGEGIERAFCQAVMPAIHLIIAGATEAGQVLALMAQELGWKITIVDPREAFASEARFGGMDRKVAWPGAALEDLTLDLRTAVVALTHAGHIDDETLAAALSGPCFYVGALGSRKTHEARVGRLTASGVGADAMARIRAPVGLNIKAKSPAEIAVSILAEIIAVQRGA